MIGFFGIFGRSRELRRLDDALRAVDLHPRLVPEAVKLTTLKLLKEEHGENPEPPAFTAAGELLGYCLMGPRAFTEANGPELTAAVEARLEAALAAGHSLDARLVLLALYAGVIQPAVVERYGLETD